MELPDGDLGDTLRRLERLDLQLEVPVDFDLLLAGPLHLLDTVAVSQQLEVLPGRADQQRQDDRADPRPAPQVAVARVVDLADDLVVPDVLADRVIEGFHHAPPAAAACARRSAARSLALRARGLRPISSSPGTTGRFVSTRTSAVGALQGAEGVFHDPVLERVEADHDHAPAVAQPIDDAAQKRLEPVQLAVHPDAQRLERARGGIDPLPATARHGAADDLRQLAGRGDRLPAACGDDRARDPPRMALLAELEDDVGELDLAGLAKQIRRGGPGAAIHAHVERPVAPEAEAAALGIELQRRHAEIGQGPIDCLNPADGEHGAERSVVSVHELDAIAQARQALGCDGQSVSVPIEADHA